MLPWHRYHAVGPPDVDIPQRTELLLKGGQIIKPNGYKPPEKYPRRLGCLKVIDLDGIISIWFISVGIKGIFRFQSFGVFVVVVFFRRSKPGVLSPRPPESSGIVVVVWSWPWWTWSRWRSTKSCIFGGCTFTKKSCQSYSCCDGGAYLKERLLRFSGMFQVSSFHVTCGFLTWPAQYTTLWPTGFQFCKDTLPETNMPTLETGHIMCEFLIFRGEMLISGMVANQQLLICQVALKSTVDVQGETKAGMNSKTSTRWKW